MFKGIHKVSEWMQTFNIHTGTCEQLALCFVDFNRPCKNKMISEILYNRTEDEMETGDILFWIYQVGGCAILNLPALEMTLKHKHFEKE